MQEVFVEKDVEAKRITGIQKFYCVVSREDGEK